MPLANNLREDIKNKPNFNISYEHKNVKLFKKNRVSRDNIEYKKCSEEINYMGLLQQKVVKDGSKSINRYLGSHVQVRLLSWDSLVEIY